MARKSVEWLKNLFRKEDQEAKGWKKIVGGAVTAALSVILIAVVIAFAVIIIQVGQGKTPSLFNRRFYYIVTDSMTPNINVGDVILSKTVTKADTELFTVGAVITYTADSGVMKGKEVTHRIVKGVYFDEDLQDFAVLTKGDKAGAKTDPPVKLSAINAVMVKKSPFMGWLLGVFKSGAGFALVIVLPLAVLLVCLIVKLVFAIKAPSSQENDAEKDRVEQLKKQAIEEYLKNQRDNDET